MGAEKPRHLFMLFRKPCNEIAGSKIEAFTGKRCNVQVGFQRICACHENQDPLHSSEHFLSLYIICIHLHVTLSPKETHPLDFPIITLIFTIQSD